MIAGCSGPDEAPTPAAPTGAAAAPATPSAPVTWAVLAPSPLTLERELREAGLADGLATFIPAKLPEMLPDGPKDRIAFRTGVVFAYTVLGGRAADKATFVGNVRSVRDGMVGINAGAGLVSSVDKAIQQIENDTASRADFLAELDAVVTGSVPTEGWGPEDTTGPMLQAGAWLAGINLSAKAIVAGDNAAAADKVLRRPEVPAFFLRYVKSEEGADKTGALSGEIAKTLGELEAISRQPTIGVADAQAIIAATDSLLSLL